MAKCMQCGGMKKATKMKSGGVKKMAAGGSTTNKLNNAKGFAPAQKGGDNGKKMIYGVPNAGMTGPNRNSQTETMKKGGAKKTTAKKPLMKKGGAMKPLRKAQVGMTQGPMTKSTVNYLDEKYPGTALKFRGPVDPEWEAEQRDRVADTQGATSWGRASDLEKNLRDREEYSIRSAGNRESFNSGDEYYKKGGTKKSTTKKPLMKKGGSIKATAKKPLAKAQFGKAQKSGFYMQAQNDATGNPTRPIASKQQRDKTKITTDKSGNETVKQKVTKYDVTSKGIKPTGTTVTKTVYDPNYNVISEKSRKGVFNIGKRQSGGSMKKMAKGGSTFGMLSVKAGVDNNPKPTAADRIAGAKMSSPKKAKFGASVSVQRSPKAGKIRSASAQGYAAVGKREPGRIIKKTIGKKK